MANIGKAFRVFWRGASALSTIQWLWGLLPAGAAAVITGLIARAEQLPPVVIGALVLGVAAFVYVLYVAFKIERLHALPVLDHKADEPDNANGSEAFRKTELASKRQRAEELADQHSGPPPSPPWIGLDDALRYIANDSDWGQAQDHTHPNFSIHVGVQMQDRLACGDLEARGRNYHTLLGGAPTPPMNALRPISQDFWADARIEAYWPLKGEKMRVGTNLVEHCVRSDGNKGVYDVQVEEDLVRAIWPPAQPLKRPPFPSSDSGKYRDVSIYEALGWAIRAQWGKPYHDFIQVPAFRGAQTDHWKFLSRFVELARDDKLTIWGKRDAPGYIQKIPASYWNDHGLTLDEGWPVGILITSRDADPYRNLELNRAEVEAAWPHEGKPPHEG